MLREFTGSITDSGLLERVLAEFEVDLVFHLAALLSTRSEFTPVTAHQVNVDGTLNLLEFAQHEGESHGRPVMFVYPSSIAAYGLPDLDQSGAPAGCREDDVEHPAHDVRLQQALLRAPGALLRATLQAAGGAPAGRVDFRCCPVSRVDFRDDDAGRRHVGFRAGDDPRRGARRAVRLLRPARHADSVHGDARRDRCAVAPRRGPGERLTRTAYNLSAFAPTAQDIHDVVLAAFPAASLSWRVDEKRQAIVDSWPEDVDDSAARRDWGFAPAFDFPSAFRDYLLPTIREHYR